MSIVALIEIRAEHTSPVREQLANAEFVEAFYELIGRYNIGIIINVSTKEDLFNIVTSIRTIPGIEETRTHLIQDGVVL
ncbi:MAG: Lrp/AsnC family transcriptional regulator [Theionarchaea archaeon]|nr:Lrp/AsnC family transcriptional regulator [Theionarchaea archaeon]MBU6999183.1 Lrp/AsnC family transcriptional regulator [Theionarchaea archaeon]MBU7019692.1 Lrp/AsnC family transcriptional regulator [Theionarchaea archaeon]MBU7034403.1 Lrp/AsnC family transcriptional regulator [Theionarchaea archaeon]MBU7041258.1 Lrp/AsnC family transcriptional regulator [Theionarchaea archaeon]